MTSRFWLSLTATFAFGLLSLGAVTAQQGQPPHTPPGAQGSDQPPPPPPGATEGVDVQARGPVHEAYAEPTEARPEPTPLVAKQPPDPVPEVPPDQRPEGDNVVWVPGYWSWDQDGNDFLWVSGFWRNQPPGRQWVPGTWQQVEGGWHWAPGYWATAQQTDVEYLPAPPPPIDQGPSTPAPADTSTYVPGCWVYRETRYFWRPGFWAPFHPGWVWCPAHYVWSPAGYVFVEGFWDRPLAERGLLFAPVRIAPRFLAVAGWSYTPAFVVQPDFLLSALFVRPKVCSYYFGDYFEASYTRAGFVPWVDYRVGRSLFDPNFAYYRHAFRGGAWERGLRGLYAARFEGSVARPPRTLVQQNQVINNITVNKVQNNVVNNNINITNIQNVNVLAPLAQVNNTRVTALASLAGARGAEVRNTVVAPRTVRLAAVPAPQRAELQKHVTQLRDVARERTQVEAKLLAQGAAPGRPADRPRTAKLALPPAPAATHTPAPARTPERAAPPPTKPGAPERPTRPTPAPAPAVRPTPPPAPVMPKHEDRTPPKYEPPKAPAPPRQPAAPPQPPKQTNPPAPRAVPPAPGTPPRPETPPTPPNVPGRPAPQPPKQTNPAPAPHQPAPPAPSPQPPAPQPRREAPPPKQNPPPKPAPTPPAPQRPDKPTPPAPHQAGPPAPHPQPPAPPNPAPGGKDKQPGPKDKQPGPKDKQ
jgi:hypothetical protein